jgi:predicted DsbA family dithiol-disulfide isomerase
MLHYAAAAAGCRERDGDGAATPGATLRFMNDTMTVDLLVDPACPWAWVTSRWLVEVEKVRPVTIHWGLFDLAEINRSEDDERMSASHAAGEIALRVLVQARRAGGQAALARLYGEMGEAWHERGESLGETATLESCATAAGLPATIVGAALDDPTTMDELLAEHHEAVEVGAFGVPTLRLSGAPAWFGPIVDVRVTGEEAGALWDDVAPLLRNTHLFELKRKRTGRADVGRYRLATAATR